jgi:RNA polymerase sigma-70 factor (ECF subfamily)
LNSPASRNLSRRPDLRHAALTVPPGIEHLGRLDLQTHRTRLLRSALVMCGNEPDAQDLVQEAFLRALESAPQFRGDSTIHTWLHGILLNLLHRLFREQKRLVLDDGLAQREAIEPASVLNIDEAKRARKVAEAVQRLTPKHREVIELKYYKNLKIREIALRAGVSVGTVKSRLHYAVLELEQFIQK